MYKITLVSTSVYKNATNVLAAANVILTSNTAATLQYTNTRVYITCSTLQIAQQIAAQLTQMLNVNCKVQVTKHASVKRATAFNFAELQQALA